MRSAEVPGFRPSVAGFAFANRWPPGPAFRWEARYVRLGIGEVAEGLCGGMCFVAADRFLAGSDLPADPEPPADGSSLFREIARRQFDSLEGGIVPARFWLAAARLAVGRWSAAAQVREWMAVRRRLDEGRPAMVGLVRSPGVNPLALTANHQVMAYGYEADAALATILLYDPNHPRRDDVTVRITLRDGRVTLEQSTGEALLALLALPYRPARR